jgi:hypothetical protein
VIPGQNCPRWCALGDHELRGPGYHRSTSVTVGEKVRHKGRGQVSAWLEQDRTGPTWLGILAAHMAAVSVEIPLTDAALLGEGIWALLDLAEAN